jgi:hypothetical protein
VKKEELERFEEGTNGSSASRKALEEESYQTSL